MTADTAVYVGEFNADFVQLKSALSGFVHKMEQVRSLEAAKQLFETQTINLVILNLGLDADQTNRIVDEIKRERPHMNFIAVGRSFQEVIEDNYYRIARNMDGTITVEQFKQAIKNVESKKAKEFRLKLCIGLVFIGGIFTIGIFSGSPLGRFLGIFWTIILAAEFGYYMFWLSAFHERTKRRQART